jgi:hypothetical protein
MKKILIIIFFLLSSSLSAAIVIKFRVIPQDFIVSAAPVWTIYEGTNYIYNTKIEAAAAACPSMYTKVNAQYTSEYTLRYTGTQYCYLYYLDNPSTGNAVQT